MYLFDVDGTLTPARGIIDSEFAEWILDFIKENNVSLVSGSDYNKTLEQVGEDILHNVQFIYSCSGNAIYKKGKLINSNEWTASNDILEVLDEELLNSPYPLRFGNHIEHRLGMLNFCTVGRNASQQEREFYNKWDNIHHERKSLVDKLSSKWPSLSITLGGDISIDIAPLGFDKSQILELFDDQVTFFGDRTLIGGNDYSLAQRIINEHRGTYHQVIDWRDTWLLLKQLSISQ